MIIIEKIEYILNNFYNFSGGIEISFSDKVIIKYRGDTYYLYCFNDLVTINNAYKLFEKTKYSYKFIYNKYNDYITYIYDKYYVLLLDLKYKFNIIQIIHPEGNKYIGKLDWKEKWQENYEFIEKNYAKIKGKYKQIDESIHYYLNMLDLAIINLKKCNNNYHYLYVQHRNINLDDFFNPFTFILDFKERDFAEYLKFIFFNNSYKKINIYTLLSSTNGIFNYDLIVSRLLLPNYYFSLLDDIILNEKDESILNSILSRRGEYELYLQNIFKSINRIVNKKKYHFNI